MAAARIHGVGDVRYEIVPKPVPGPGEVLLRVAAVGLCGSDHHYYREGGIGTARITEPLILGHEYAAWVADAGGADQGLRPGTLVAVDPATPCGQCEWCRRDHRNLCPQVCFAGSPPAFAGALAEFAVARVELLHAVPSGLSPATTALLEPLGVALHAVDLAHLNPVETVAILGAGPIGLLAMQVARLAGAGLVYVIDPLPGRAAAAGRMGADAWATSFEQIAVWTQGRGVDVVIEATDSAAAPDQATRAVRIGGRVILAGIPNGEEFSLSASVVRRKGLSLKMVRRMGHVYPRAIFLASRRKVALEPLVSHRMRLEQVPEAFAIAASHRDETCKMVIELGGGPG
jgi:L-iditol 2-dehydrogenase